MNDAPQPIHPSLPDSPTPIDSAPAPVVSAPAPEVAVPTPVVTASVPVARPVPTQSSFAPHLPSSPTAVSDPAFVPSPMTEPVNAYRATNPLLAMLGGALLSALLLGAGIAIGRAGAGKGAMPVGVGGNTAQDIDDPVIRVAREVGPAVMNVDTTFGKKGKSAFLPKPGQQDDAEERKGKGTGFVFDSAKGYMLTNAHVAAGAKELQVTTSDGRKITGKVLGYDRRSDIAVVQLADRHLPQVKLATFTDPKKLEVGEGTVAIGNPFGQENTVTAGVLSAVGRTLPVPANEGSNDGGAFELTDMLQTDTAINPGNSGGPLINLKGEVIGINTAIIPFGQGLGFSIPINKAKKVADEIIAHGKVFHPYLGVNVQTINDAIKQDYGLPDKNGVLVQSLASGSPAEKAGIKPGDVIRSVAGKPLKAKEDLAKNMEGRKVGETVKIEILRNNSVKKTMNVKIEDRPDQGE
ncbi:putative serine protease HtrA [Abditibacteriota bacterium]|nr:putative serine protease HtrA [Abditibacteriota bacterium]